MKCLDEGVDVPATEIAYILASSSNPIQFVQRRGRILRKTEYKQKAIIHDFIAVPSLSGPSEYLSEFEIEIERKIIKRELRRFKEFASVANNHFQATEKVLELAKAYRILDF